MTLCWRGFRMHTGTFRLVLGVLGMVLMVTRAEAAGPHSVDRGGEPVLFASAEGPTAPAAPPQADAEAWYRSPVAVGVYAVVGLFLLVGYLQWRIAILTRTRKRLEDVLSDRTAEVHLQNRQLETYNRELIHTNKRLRETLEEKSRLLGVATHDLKNPLFGMRALAEILLERESLSERARRKIDLIRTSAQETLEQIDGLMESAASTAGYVEDEPVNVSALAGWVVNSFEPQAQRKDQTLRCTVPDVPCIVAGDRGKLREAMINLISNALKYAPPGTSVDVTVTHADRTVRFSVSDQGPGLSMRDQERLFAPFRRLTPKPTGDEGTSGLGLYIVKQIVSLHNGDVEVDTALGEGSTFTLVLPSLDAERYMARRNESVGTEVESE